MYLKCHMTWILIHLCCFMLNKQQLEDQGAMKTSLGTKFWKSIHQWLVINKYHKHFIFRILIFFLKEYGTTVTHGGHPPISTLQIWVNWNGGEKSKKKKKQTQNVTFNKNTNITLRTSLNCIFIQFTFTSRKPTGPKNTAKSSVEYTRMLI